MAEAGSIPLTTIRIGVNTQTPLFRPQREWTVRGAGKDGSGQNRVALTDLAVGRDYRFSTGGVTRMVRPLLRLWRKRGVISQAVWVCMNGGNRGVPVVDDGGVLHAFVDLGPEQRKEYARVKERLWNLLNGAGSPEAVHPPGAAHDDGRVSDPEWTAFDAYQARSAAKLAETAESLGGVDLLYVHDFQQLGVGTLWPGAGVPRIFHLHTPFPRDLPGEWQQFFARRLNAFDAVIVSTRPYAAALKSAGVTSPIHIVRPFIDPESYPDVNARSRDRIVTRFGFGSADRIILNVARMDPIKGQDRLIRAMPEILENEPEARLVLVGNGSFSSSPNGGLGLSKGSRWRTHLEAVAEDAGVTGRVVFTGHLSDRDIITLYRLADLFVLPSTREGFGLAVIEAWREGLPVVVSDRAGVSDLVEDGINGFVVDASDPHAIAEPITRILADGGFAESLGLAGFEASEEATLPVGAAKLEAIMAEVIRNRASPPSPAPSAEPVRPT